VLSSAITYENPFALVGVPIAIISQSIAQVLNLQWGHQQALFSSPFRTYVGDPIANE